MTALLMLVAVPVVMWGVQTLQLRAHGLPVRWRIDAGDAPRSVRSLGRLVTQVSLLAVIVSFPLLKGRSPLEYYAALFPPTGSALQAVQGAAVTTLFLCILYMVWIATDCLRVSVHQSRQRWMRRLILLLPTACFGAMVEEMLFRGVVMADLMESAWLARYTAVGFAVLVFAAAHYVRGAKRRWTFFGHLVLGLLLCVAFLRTGTLWLAVGLHAGGILMIMGTRPFVRYRGPSWLTGASVYPYAGVVGMLGLGILTGVVARWYG